MVMHQDASTGEMVDSAEDAADQTAPGGKPTMDIKIYAPFKVYFEGKGLSLTAVNRTGPFDVLPHHHNFLCMLLPCDMKIVTPTTTRTIRIGRALMHVREGKVTVFVDV